MGRVHQLKSHEEYLTKLKGELQDIKKTMKRING